MLQGYLTYLFIHYTLFNGVPAPVFSSKRRTKVPNVPEQNGGTGGNWGNGGLVSPFPESFCKSKTYMVQFLANRQIRFIASELCSSSSVMNTVARCPFLWPHTSSL